MTEATPGQAYGHYPDDKLRQDISYQLFRAGVSLANRAQTVEAIMKPVDHARPKINDHSKVDHDSKVDLPSKPENDPQVVLSHRVLKLDARVRELEVALLGMRKALRGFTG